MDKKNQNCGIRRWRMIFLFFVFLFAGCEAQKRSCPPIATSAEATAVLAGYSSRLKPLKATGNCTLSYTNEKKETFSQSFPVRIWFESNNKFCLYGDVMFDPKGISFVVMDGQYWTYAKPFGTYAAGEVNAASEDYFSNPAVLVDFLAPVGRDCDKIYLAESDNKFNILMCRDSKNCRTKKVFIDRCSKFVKKIEYLNCPGNVLLAVEPDEYKEVDGAKGFLFPRKLIYKYSGDPKGTNQMQIKLDSVQIWKQQPQQVKALFTPPDISTIQKEKK
jgi:hypothetical protein